MKPLFFKDFDFTDFWDDKQYALEEYVSKWPSEELIASVEEELGYKLPACYIELMKMHNGGIPKNYNFPTTEKTSWAEDHVAIESIMGIGYEKSYSLCGDSGSQFWIEEWGYPDHGIYICDCPSAGHDMILLDYSKCGKNGEPEVVHVDQEYDYKKTFLAKDFETFVRGLVHSDVYDNAEEELIEQLEIFKSGNFSDVLQDYFKIDSAINFDSIFRKLFTILTKEKGYFALHADALSYLAYDLQFYLLSNNTVIQTKDDYIQGYIPMVSMANNEISTNGYANFFENWFDERMQIHDILKGDSGSLKFSESYEKLMFEKLKVYE